MSQLLSLENASARLGVTVSTVRRWARRRLVPTYRVGKRFIRVDWDELLSALAAAREPAVQAATSARPEPSASETPANLEISGSIATPAADASVVE